MSRKIARLLDAAVFVREESEAPAPALAPVPAPSTPAPAKPDAAAAAAAAAALPPPPPPPTQQPLEDDSFWEEYDFYKDRVSDDGRKSRIDAVWKEGKGKLDGFTENFSRVVDELVRFERDFARMLKEG